MEAIGLLLESTEVSAECEFRFSLTAVGSVGESEKFGFRAEIRMRASFKSEAVLSGSQWQEFASVQNVLLVWPYARELVSSISSRMALPLFLLPLLEIPGTSRGNRDGGTEEAGR